MKKLIILLTTFILIVALGACVKTPTFDTGQVSVVFYTNTASGGSFVETLTDIDKGTVIEQPADPTRIGTEFIGWFTSRTYTTPFDFSQPINQSVTIYARWEYVLYTITWNLNGGTIIAGREGAFPNTFHVYSPDIVLRGEFLVRPGFVQRGFFTTPNFQAGTQITRISPSTATAPLADIVLYVRWIEL